MSSELVFCTKSFYVVVKKDLLVKLLSSHVTQVKHDKTSIVSPDVIGRRRANLRSRMFFSVIRKERFVVGLLHISHTKQSFFVEVVKVIKQLLDIRVEKKSASNKITLVTSSGRM